MDALHIELKNHMKSGCRTRKKQNHNKYLSYNGTHVDKHKYVHIIPDDGPTYKRYNTARIQHLVLLSWGHKASNYC